MRKKKHHPKHDKDHKAAKDAASENAVEELDEFRNDRANEGEACSDLEEV